MTPVAGAESINDRPCSVLKIKAHLFKLTEIKCNLVGKASVKKVIANKQSVQQQNDVLPSFAESGNIKNMHELEENLCREEDKIKQLERVGKN